LQLNWGAGGGGGVFFDFWFWGVIIRFLDCWNSDF